MNYRVLNQQLKGEAPMDRTKTDRINGNESSPPQAPDGAFSFRDPATGKIRKVSEMTDEELKRYMAEGNQGIVEQQNQMNETLRAIQHLAGFLTVLQYELHRRHARVVVIPADLRI